MIGLKKRTELPIVRLREFAKRFDAEEPEAVLGRKEQKNRYCKVTDDVGAYIRNIVGFKLPAGNSRWRIQVIADELIRWTASYIMESTV